jgi:DNA-binding NtrC family response regulator
MNNILIVEDEQVIREALTKLLLRNNFKVDSAESAEQAQKSYQLSDYDLVLVDIRLPGAPGTSLIEKLPNIPVLVMTSYASVRSAVDAMKLGAADYIAKPFDHDELLSTIKRLIRKNRQAKEKQDSGEEEALPVTGMIGNCPAMKQVYNMIRKVAPTDASVLILGESGTGKELAARSIHQQSQRKDAPFVAVNCAAIPETLVESELFGHIKGAFTSADSNRIGMLETAHQGTLFLDEVAELPLSAQARLLRVLQNGEMRRVGSEHVIKVDIRLLAATNRDLRQMVDQDEFRSDLYFRLHVVELTMPPLRARERDIQQLTDQILGQLCQQLAKPAMHLSPEARASIASYPWPGNVRELKNALERAVILADNQQISTELLSIDREQQSSSDHSDSLEDYFRQFVLENQQSMTETELSKQLGISRKTLWERRQRMKLPRPGK